MNRKLEITYIDTKHLSKRNETLYNILAGGVYNFLKNNAYLRKKDTSKIKKIRQTIEDTKKLKAKLEAEKALFEQDLFNLT